MCLPTKNDQSDASAPGARSMLGIGALMLIACLAGPAIVAAVSSLGVGVLVGAGGAIAAIALCAATVPVDPKAVVRRLIEDVINAGRLELIDELYAPHMAASARRWIAPFRESFPDVHLPRPRRPDHRGVGDRGQPLT